MTEPRRTGANDLEPEGVALLQRLRNLAGQNESWTRELEARKDEVIQNGQLDLLPPPPVIRKSRGKGLAQEVRNRASTLKRQLADRRRKQRSLEQLEAQLRRARRVAAQQKRLRRMAEQALAAITVISLIALAVLWVLRAPG